VSALKGNVEYVILDRLNYHYADWAYKKYEMQWAMEDRFFSQKGEELKMHFKGKAFPVRLYFRIADKTCKE